jgi:hypothetical protein
VRYVVTFDMALDQDISAFDGAALRPRIASMVGVSLSQVQVSAEAGSVIMTVSVRADGGVQLAAVVGSVNALTLASASDALETPVLSVDTAAQVEEVGTTPEPLPPTQPPLQPPRPPRPPPGQALSVVLVVLLTIACTLVGCALFVALIPVLRMRLLRARRNGESSVECTASGAPIGVDGQVRNADAPMWKEPRRRNGTAPPRSAPQSGEAVRGPRNWYARQAVHQEPQLSIRSIQAQSSYV